MLYQELKKCFFTDKTLVLLLCICFLGIGLYWYSAYMPYMGDEYYPADYRNLVEKYKKAEEGKEEFSNIESEYSLALKDVKKEWEDVSEYSTYIESITRENAFGLQKASGYENKLQKQYNTYYKDLKNVTLSFKGNRGISLFADIDVCDGILFFGIFFVLFRIITLDRETDMEPVLFCTKNGTFSLYQRKWIVGSILIVGIVILFYIMKLNIYAIAYGFKDWNGYLQSVPGYLSADIPLRIWQFVIIVIIGKIMGFWLLYSVFYQINFYIYSYRKAFLVDLILCGISIVMVLGIESNRRWADLKLISPMYLIDIGYLLLGYHPVKLFGYPVSYLSIWCMACVILLVGIMWMMTSSKWYQKKNQLSGNKREKKQSKGFFHWNISGSTLFFWEWKKWMGLERGIYLVFALGFVVFATYRLPQEYIESKDELYYKAIVTEYKGKVTKSKQKEVNDELAELEKIEQDVLEQGEKYTTTAYQVALETLEKKPSLNRFVSYQDYIKRNHGRSVVYEKGYEMLFGKKVSGSYLNWCNLLGIIFICLLSESLWGMEKSSGMDCICPVTRAGMKRINRRKTLELFFLCVLVGIMIYLPWIYLSAKAYDLQEWNAAIDSLQIFSSLSNLTIGAALILYYLLHIAYLFGVGMTMKVIREKIDSPIVAVLIVCLIGILPCLWIA